MKKQPTPETDEAIALASDPNGAKEVCDLCKKLEIDRNYWRLQHDKVCAEYQHRLMTMAMSAIDMTAYPEGKSKRKRKIKP
jgi:hypothetical protein